MIFWIILHTICCIAFGFALRELISVSTSKTTDYYIDWSKIPDGYDWVAVDGYGDIVGMYKAEPRKIEELSHWTNMEDYDDVPKDAIISPLPPWRESLRRRPR